MKFNTCANNLKRLRIKGKKTRKEVADAVGVSTSAIAMYERGERIPRDDIKVAFAKYFKTTVESIFFTK